MTSSQIFPNQNDLVEIIKGFSLWLSSKSYSSSTVRNYLSDINAYFNFVKSLSVKNSTIDDLQSTIYTPETVSSYLQTIQKDSAYSRYLSSLSKFFQYAIDQNLIKSDPLKQAKKVKKPTSNEILDSYKSFLIKKKFSQSTIRNYINDIQQFINFIQINHSEPN